MTSLNMRAIQTVTVGAGGTSTISFTSIPQTYTDLLIKISGRATTGGESNTYITFNGGGGSYTGRRLYATGNGIGTDTTGQWVGFSNASTFTAGAFSNNDVYIPNYTSSNIKIWSVDSVNETNAVNALSGIGAQTWSGTAAITSIALTADNPWAQYSTATLYGISNAATGAKATGGIISQDANYFYHTFTSSGTFTPSQNLTSDVLIVAGAGGGGYFSGGGGGGAGGLQYGTLSLTSSTNYAVTIGGGGTTPYPGAGAGGDGSNSSFTATYVSNGGGGGGGQGSLNGRNGGSGGGAATGGGSAGSATQGSTSPLTGYGNNGGVGTNNCGGGGAGSAGSGQTAGSGRTYFGNTYAVGGRGVDGPATPGPANSGNGGPQGSAGGSGIVIVRYAR